jgi:hypothetical protein
MFRLLNQMKKLTLIFLILSICGSSFAATEYAEKYPTKTALAVVTPSNASSYAWTVTGNQSSLSGTKSGTFDLTTTGTIIGAIPELASDPIAPVAQQSWVLRSGSGAIPDGTPIGMLLCLTYTGNGGSSFTYQFSYETIEGTIVRATIN